MTDLVVTDRGRQDHALEAAEGLSLIEAIRDAGIDELLALCGGGCSCAMCHVNIQNGPANADQVGRVDEDDLLESSDPLWPNSRLSCQMLLTNESVDLVVRIAPED